jgi:MoxR-like ATPase
MEIFPQDPELRSAAESIRAAVDHASQGLVEREALIETVMLAAVAGEHVLVFGPPGTAKSEAIRRIARSTGMRGFEYLLGRFTEPTEIFGPVDLARLREGRVETRTEDMLPEAEIAFLDEIFLGSSAILNTLLGILNERIFRRGHTRVECPLRICVGASNTAPDDDSLAAFADRFLVWMHLGPIGDPRLEELLDGGWALHSRNGAAVASVADIDTLARAARSADMTAVRPHIAHAIRRLRKAGIALTDRRAVKTQLLVAAAAAMAGRRVPSEADLWPLVLAVPAAADQDLARDALADLLSASHNPSLSAAAADASRGPLARASRIAMTARETLGAAPASHDAEAMDAWGLRLEAIMREIDASFAPDRLPQELAPLRSDIAAILEARFKPA